jgi:hypothetical protein
MIEIYRFFGDLAIVTGISLAVVYAVLSLIYFTYKYAKGDEIPELENSIPDIIITNLSDIRFYINPFYFKHPVYSIMTTVSIVIIPFIIAVGWPILIPLSIVFYFIHRTRKVNLDKKKMWGKLSE